MARGGDKLFGGCKLTEELLPLPSNEIKGTFNPQLGIYVIFLPFRMDTEGNVGGLLGRLGYVGPFLTLFGGEGVLASCPLPLPMPMSVIYELNQYLNYFLRGSA